MTVRKTIVCLANSRKHNGRCIAGIEIVDRRPEAWVRPVSSRARAEVSEDERRYEDGSDPRVLDIIEIPLLDAVPDGYQVENWTLDPDRYWVKKGQVAWADLATGWVTDPATEREYLAKDGGEHSLGECYLTISLGERSDDGYCYKLIAAVISQQRAEDGS